MKRKPFQKKVDRLWQSAKKDLDKILRDAVDLVKKGEHYIKDKSEEGKIALEIATLTLQREKSYYELGKALVKFPKSKWGNSQKLANLLKSIKSANLKIKKKKKK
ncbi:MAG: hypothetical protein ISS45_10660 [Candidatus Omnitrophica bacterium]|nr:hypothetical protein [Candidatus Omnitrophota bacterium]